MNWLLRVIFNAIIEGIIALLDMFKPILNNIYTTMYRLNSTIELQRTKEYTMSIGLTMLGVYVIKLCIDIYVLQIEGDPDADPIEMLTRVAKTCAIIICGDWLIDKMIYFASLVTDEVIRSLDMPSQNIFDEALVKLNIISGSAATSAFIILILFSIVIITYILLIFKAGKRAAELVLFSLVLPIVALDNLTTTRERWNYIFNELITCVFGYIIQVICLCIFFNIFGESLRNNLSIGYMILGIVWLMLIKKSPKWLEKWTYTSGVGNAARGSARTVTYIMPTIIRSMK